MLDVGAEEAEGKRFSAVTPHAPRRNGAHRGIRVHGTTATLGRGSQSQNRGIVVVRGIGVVIVVVGGKVWGHGRGRV